MNLTKICQGFFAGIGNYLRSEVLFTAKLHPDRTVSSLDEDEKSPIGETVDPSEEDLSNDELEVNGE